MKKIIIAFTIFTGLVASMPAGAQEYSYRENSAIGLKGGLNMSSLTIDENSDKNLKFGFHVGAFNKIPISDRFAIQPELLYSVKGLEYSYENTTGVDGESQFNLHYIDLPVLLVFNLAEDFSFQIGPYIGYLAHANVDTDATILNSFGINENEEIDRDNFNKFDYGLTAGMTFDLDPFLVGFDYSMGLNPVSRDDKSAKILLGDAKNRVIQVFAGLKF